MTSVNSMSGPFNSMSTVKAMSTSQTNFEYPQPQQRSIPSYFTNTTLIPTYTSECFQRMYQSPTRLTELADPGWTYDDLGPPVNYQTNIAAVTSGALPTNPIRRSTVSETRLATASSMREQLLTDILRDMGDINEEITSMEGQLSRSRQMPYGYSSALDRELPTVDLEPEPEPARYIPRLDLNPKNADNTSDWS
jgi:hypothetical protein